VQGKYIISDGRLNTFSFIGPCRPDIPVVRGAIIGTEDTSDITRSFLLVAFICQVVSDAFDTSRFETAAIFCVPHLWQFVHWAISPLCFGGSNFILHCCIYSTFKISLVFGTVLILIKNMEREMFNVPDVCYRMPKFFYF
jgi:hypothetical protein